MKVLDLFSGIGGMTVGLTKAGHETVAFCEVEEPCRRLLAHHFNGVEIHADVRTADLGSIGPVDLVAAGFPCQDISQAGKRAGLSGERSGLFWHVLRAARMVGRPKLLLENVAALLVRGMGDVLGALAESGHDAEWDCVSAANVGAPHRRDRIWIIADPVGGEQPWKEPRIWTIGRMGGANESIPWNARWEVALTAFRGMDDGIPRSVDRTDGIRNSVVPQVVEQVGRII